MAATATQKSAEIIGFWCDSKNTRLEFCPDGSYSLTIEIDPCKDCQRATGNFSWEKPTLQFDVDRTDAVGTYKVCWTDQFQINFSPQNDNNKERQQALSYGPFQRLCRHDDLCREIRSTERCIYNHLNTVTSSWWRRLLGNPVRTKNLEKAAAHLHAIQTYIANPDYPLPCSIYETLPMLLAQLGEPQKVSFNQAWELADALGGELLQIGDQNYLARVWMTRPEISIPVFSKEPPGSDGRKEKSVSDSKDALQEEIKIVRSFLVEGQRQQAQEYRRDRAKIALRQHYLFIITVLLVIFDVGFCFLYNAAIPDTGGQANQPALSQVTVSPELTSENSGGMSVTPTGETSAGEAVTSTPAADSQKNISDEEEAKEEDPDLSTLFELLLVLAAGAIGSMVSRAFKLGNQRLGFEEDGGKDTGPPLGIRSLMSAWTIFPAQAVIGATAGLIVYLALVSSLLPFTISTEQTLAAYAVLSFLVGYSEPFFTDVVGKITGTVAAV